MSILCARRATAIGLGKSKCNRSLPRAKIYILRSLPQFFHCSLHLALKFQLSNLAAHGREQSKIPRMRFPRLLAENVPAGLIHAEGRETDCALSQSGEQELSEAIAPSGLGDPNRIVWTVIG